MKVTAEGATRPESLRQNELYSCVDSGERSNDPPKGQCCAHAMLNSQVKQDRGAADYQRVFCRLFFYQENDFSINYRR